MRFFAGSYCYPNHSADNRIVFDSQSYNSDRKGDIPLRYFVHDIWNSRLHSIGTLQSTHKRKRYDHVYHQAVKMAPTSTVNGILNKTVKYMDMKLVKHRVII